MDERLLDEIKRYVGFDEGDAKALAELRPLLVRSADRVAHVFYERIQAHPRVARLVAGGPPQIERLKTTLRRWLIELGDGVYEDAYFERRAQIGRRHVQIELPQVFMITGMDVVRRELAAIVRREMADDPGRRERSLEALQKILDIDLAIMLETFHEDSLEKMLQSERRAMVGELAARINHELRQRLGVIKSSAFLLEKQLGPAAETITKHLTKIQDGAERAASIVSSLLNLARELKPTMVPMDLNAVVREAVAAVPPHLNVAIDLELGRNLPRVKADPELMQSVVANLVVNAVQAHGDKGGRVTVATGNGSGVTLRVADEGPGIPSDVLPRLFQPFFTTKPTGTGLGLVISREIVTAHGGTIEARNRSDRSGAEFLVQLVSEAKQ